MSKIRTEDKKNKPSSAPTEKTVSKSDIQNLDKSNISQSEKKSITKDGRYRQWTIVAYPDSAPQDWRQKLDGLQWVESPLHDKDINADGTPKKPHWHIMIFNAGKISYNQAKEIADSIHGASPQYVQNVVGMVRYFAHLDNPEKAQYEKSEIIGHGVDVTKYLDSEDDIDKLEQDIEIFCEDNNITEYAQLIKISRQFDGWHKCVSTHTIHFKAFVTSLRHSPTPTESQEQISDLASQALNQESKE